MAFLDTLNTVVTKTIIPGITDLVFKSGPTLDWLRRNCLYPYEGGLQWQENIGSR